MSGSLLKDCVSFVADHMEELSLLNGIEFLRRAPDEVCEAILLDVLSKGKLNSRVVKMFRACGHKEMAEVMASLDTVPFTILPYGCKPSRF